MSLAELFFFKNEQLLRSNVGSFSLCAIRINKSSCVFLLRCLKCISMILQIFPKSWDEAVLLNS